MTFKTKPQYLLSIGQSVLPLPPEQIYKVDYDLDTKKLKAYPFAESPRRSLKPVIVITLRDGDKVGNYRWYRPNIDAIIEEGYLDLLNRLLHQDVLMHYLRNPLCEVTQTLN
jgi:hypothetical protein